jgi:hypothetical protein
MAGSFLLAKDTVPLVTAITVIGLAVVGLAVLVGKLPVDDALVRIAVMVVILALAPCIAGFMTAALPLLVKPVLLLLLLVVVVTIFARVLINLI